MVRYVTKKTETAYWETKWIVHNVIYQRSFVSRNSSEVERVISENKSKKSLIALWQ